MDYISEIRAFFDWLQLNPLPADAQALWHMLIYVNNKCAIHIDGTWCWLLEFTVPNKTLTSMLGFSRTQLDRMRNTLIQRGRILYKKGCGNQAGTYQLIPFGEHYVTQTVTHPVTQKVTQVRLKVKPLNNTIYTDNSNSLSGGGEGAATSEGEKAVRDFAIEEGDDLDAYLAVDEEVKAEVAKIAKKIFELYTKREPTRMDESMVFPYVRPLEGGVLLPFPEERVRLLLYAFRQANGAGKPGDWRYIIGVLARLYKRGHDTVEKAEDFDDLLLDLRR